MTDEQTRTADEGRRRTRRRSPRRAVAWSLWPESSAARNVGSIVTIGPKESIVTMGARRTSGRTGLAIESRAAERRADTYGRSETLRRSRSPGQHAGRAP